MTSTRTKRIVIATMLACLILPVIIFGTSPVDAVHGLSGPLNYSPNGAITKPNEGIFQ